MVLFHFQKLLYMALRTKRYVAQNWSTIARNKAKLQTTSAMMYNLLYTFNITFYSLLPIVLCKCFLYKTEKRGGGNTGSRWGQNQKRGDTDRQPTLKLTSWKAYGSTETIILMNQVLVSCKLTWTAFGYFSNVVPLQVFWRAFWRVLTTHSNSAQLSAHPSYCAHTPLCSSETRPGHSLEKRGFLGWGGRMGAVLIACSFSQPPCRYGKEVPGSTQPDTRSHHPQTKTQL